MKLQIGRFAFDTKAAPAADLITHLPTTGWWPIVRESFAGAWQRGVVTPVEDALTHPTFWACVTLIAGDVAKLRPMLVEDVDGIDVEVDGVSPFRPVVDRPNHYQNRIQFYTYWILSKLTRGNAYALKERDARGIVTALYLLDPTRVRPLVTPSGDVYYACQQDILAGVDTASIVVPARDIIHDSGPTPYHPLIGFSPVYAAGASSLQALSIVNNTTRLFQRGSSIGGVLVAPGQISDTAADTMRQNWEKNYAGPENAGRIAVLGNGLKFEKFDIMSATDAQLIEQLKWDDEKICAVFHVPPFMVGVGALPSYNNVEALAQQYYTQCLQVYVEALELCLTEGLELAGPGYEIEFDVDALLRMDSVAQMDVATKGVVGGVLMPNEARARFNLKPVPGGDRIYLQKQNWPLENLGADATPPAPAAPAAPAMPPGMPGDMPAKTIDAAALLIGVLDRLEGHV